MQHFLHKFFISALAYVGVLFVNCSLFSGLAWADTVNIPAITRVDLGSLDVCTSLLIFDLVKYLKIKTVKKALWGTFLQKLIESLPLHLFSYAIPFFCVQLDWLVTCHRMGFITSYSETSIWLSHTFFSGSGVESALERDHASCLKVSIHNRSDNHLLTVSISLYWPEREPEEVNTDGNSADVREQTSQLSCPCVPVGYWCWGQTQGCSLTVL